ncbi:MAG: beta-ketoacyl-[acyl-carrier-protein] synthase family protein, partial [Gammaproteobacteria bacterium]|nr:beta-ketoacyl-[acyl-carrier-protein] synthase family protein [Gammaproteobacteria bacterium]
QLDPVTMLTICAAREALERAGISIKLVNRRANTYRIEHISANTIGVYMGTGIGGAHSFLENHYHPILARHKACLQELANEKSLDERARSVINRIVERMFHLGRVNPFVVSMLMPNAVSACLGLKFSITGPNTTFALACASGTAAIGHAYRAVKKGIVKVALTGGAEYLNDHYGYIFRGFDIARTLASGYDIPDKANCPFDVKHSGFLFSEGGAGLLVLEELSHALGRGAPILAEITGFAETFEAHSIMRLSRDGREIERMIRMVLVESGLAEQDVQYINAHGTGTKNNDETEASILFRCFGDKPLVNSTKSLLGHTIGASGALEAIVTALSIDSQTTHISRNLREPILDLNFVTRSANFEINAALTQSFAFGGHNAAIAMKRFR